MPAGKLLDWQRLALALQSLERHFALEGSANGVFCTNGRTGTGYGAGSRAPARIRRPAGTIHRAWRETPAGAAIRRGFLAGGARGGHDPRIRLHLLSFCARKSGTGADCQARQLRAAAAASGRRLEHLSRGTFGAECHDESVLRIEACGRFAGFAAPDASARGDPPAWRARAHELVRAVLPGAGGRRGVGAGSVDSAGVDAVAELVLSEHLRDVVVDARNRDPHGDSLGAASGLALAGTRASG